MNALWQTANSQTFLQIWSKKGKSVWMAFLFVMLKKESWVSIPQSKMKNQKEGICYFLCFPCAATPTASTQCTSWLRPSPQRCWVVWSNSTKLKIHQRILSHDGPATLQNLSPCSSGCLESLFDLLKSSQNCTILHERTWWPECRKHECKLFCLTCFT